MDGATQKRWWVMDEQSVVLDIEITTTAVVRAIRFDDGNYCEISYGPRDAAKSGPAVEGYLTTDGLIGNALEIGDEVLVTVKKLTKE